MNHNREITTRLYFKTNKSVWFFHTYINLEENHYYKLKKNTGCNVITITKYFPRMSSLEIHTYTIRTFKEIMS